LIEVSTSASPTTPGTPTRWASRDWADAHLTNTIVKIQRMRRPSYGSPRVHAELRLGQDLRCARKRVERRKREARIIGIHRRRGGCTRRDSAGVVWGLVKRTLTPPKPTGCR
jgi:putative transposase